MKTLRFLASLAVLTLVGCSEPLESITDVIKPRTIGALVRVDGDPTRSTPAPGETVEIELVVADPGPRTGRTWAFVVCIPSATQFDVGACESLIGGPFLSPPLPGAADPKPAPRFSFVVPDEATLGEATRLLVLGGVCADGDVNFEFDPGAFQGEATTANPCVDQTKQGTLVTMAIALERTIDDRNFVPEFATIALDDVPWTISADEDDLTEGCRGLGFPERVHTTVPLAVQMALTDGSRETYVNSADPPETVVEEPYVAFQGTAGDFQGAYSFFDDTPNTPTFTWEMPPRASVPDVGLLVRFWFVLRDGRGGSTAVERALCVVP